MAQMNIRLLKEVTEHLNQVLDQEKAILLILVESGTSNQVILNAAVYIQDMIPVVLMLLVSGADQRVVEVMVEEIDSRLATMKDAQRKLAS